MVNFTILLFKLLFLLLNKCNIGDHKRLLWKYVKMFNDLVVYDINVIITICLDETFFVAYIVIYICAV